MMTTEFWMMTTEKEIGMTDHMRPDVEEDGLYYKYRVFKEPENADTHPVVMTAYYTEGHQAPAVMGTILQPEDVIGYAEEVQDFIFPLKPDTDHHARVALAAYATSVSQEKPRLAQDLFILLRDMLEDLNPRIH